MAVTDQDFIELAEAALSDYPNLAEDIDPRAMPNLIKCIAMAIAGAAMGGAIDRDFGRAGVEYVTRHMNDNQPEVRH